MSELNYGSAYRDAIAAVTGPKHVSDSDFAVMILPLCDEIDDALATNQRAHAEIERLNKEVAALRWALSVAVAP